MEPVENDFYTRQCCTDGPEIGAAHVHRHCFEPSRSSGQAFQEGSNVFFALSFDCVQNPAGTQIGDNGHVMIALLEAEFVNADELHLVKRHFPVKKLQSFFVDVFDQVPAYSKVFGDRANRPEFEQVQDSKRKRSNKAVCPHHEWKCRPPKSRTFTALHAVKDKIEQTLLAP